MIAWASMGGLRCLDEPPVYWGVLALGFILASYRTWAKAQFARTTDCIGMLLEDAQGIKQQLQWIVENYPWPPMEEIGQPPKPSAVVRPMTAESLSGRASKSIYVALAEVANRLYGHARLVEKVTRDKEIELPAPPYPPVMHYLTMLTEFDAYLGTLKRMSRPPTEHFLYWSKKRFLQSTMPQEGARR